MAETAQNLEKALQNWPVARLAAIYIEYQLRQDALPANKRSLARNPLVRLSEIKHWVAADRDDNMQARKRALAGLCTVTCELSGSTTHLSDYGYSCRRYDLDIPAILLEGDLRAKDPSLLQIPAPQNMTEYFGKYADMQSVHAMEQELERKQFKPLDRPLCGPSTMREALKGFGYGS